MHLIQNKTVEPVWFANALSERREELAPNAYGICQDQELSRIRDLVGVEILKEIEASDVLRSLQSQTKKNYPAPLVTRGKVLFLWGHEKRDFMLWSYHVAVSLASSGYAVHILTQNAEIPAAAEDYKVAGRLTWEKSHFTTYGSFDFVAATPSTAKEALEFCTVEGTSLVLLTEKETSVEASVYLVPSFEIKARMESKGFDNVRTVPSFVSEGAYFISESVGDYFAAVGKDSSGFFKRLKETEEEFRVEFFGNEAVESDAKHPVVNVRFETTQKRLTWLAKAKALVVLSYNPFDHIIREALALGTPVLAPNIVEFKQEFGDNIIYYNDPITTLPKINGRERKRIAEFVGWSKKTSLLSYSKKSFAVGSSTIIFWGPKIEKGGGISYMLQMMKEAHVKGFSVFYIGSSGARTYVEKYSKGFDLLYLEFSSDEAALQYIETSKASMLVVDSFHSLSIPSRVSDVIPTVVVWQYWPPFVNRVTDIENFDLKEVNDKLVRSYRLWKGIIVNSPILEQMAKRIFGNFPVWTITPPIPKVVKRGRKSAREYIVIPLMENIPDQSELVYKMATSLKKEKFLVLDIRGGDNYTKNLNKISNLEILKGVVNPEQYYKKAKVVVVPTLVAHTFCMQAAEALSFGAPVVALKDGNLPYLVDKGGVLVKGNDSNEWIAAIETIIKRAKQYETGADEDAKNLKNFSQTTFEDVLKANFSQTEAELGLAANKNIPGGWRMFRELERILPKASMEASSGKTLYFNEFYMQRNYKPGDGAVFASSPLQIELDREDEQFKTVFDHKDAIIVCPSPAMAEFFSLKGLNAVEIPVPAPTPTANPDIEFKAGHVMLPYWLGAGRKNIFGTLIALLPFEDLTIHVTKRIFEDWAKLFQGELNLTQFDLLSDSAYFGLLQSMEFGLYLSVGETFNQAAFEALYLGVPSLISNSAFFAKALPDKLGKKLIVENIEDLTEIRTKIDVMRKSRDKLSEEVALWAADFAEEHNLAVQEKYERVFGG